MQRLVAAAAVAAGLAGGIGCSDIDGPAVLVKDINVGSGGSDPGSLTALGAFAVFTADDGIHGTELWRTDGRPDGTFLVKDIAPGRVGSSPRGLARVGPNVFFAATDVENGNELWKTDGTAAGTMLVKDISAGPSTQTPSRCGDSHPSEITSFGGVAYFAACDEQHGWELWRSDGTGSGTVVVHDIFPGPGGVGRPYGLTVWNGVLYFFADHPAYGLELWRTDGTAAGTWLVKDVRPGADPPPIRGRIPGTPCCLVDAGHALFFEGNGRLWRTDGTPEGTREVHDVQPDLLTAAPPLVYFAGPGGLWRSDGTPGGTRLLKELFMRTRTRFDDSRSDIYASRGTLFFGADLPLRNARSRNEELWKSDGTPEGTVLIADIRPGPESSTPTSFLAAGRFLYFTADDGTNGRQVWRTTGTAVGTVRLTSLAHVGSPAPWFPDRLLAHVGDRLLFPADEPAYGRELWALPTSRLSAP